MTEKTLSELKAEVYDLLVEQQRINLRLQEVNSKIASLESAQAKKVSKKQ